ncbi:MAG TPA: type II toxin-antitoxin system VapC family toxin [Thermoanaerobaculia bacterium]|nr:type II toxin-antitoxin system VapC family toxin [Thermoanaerobaculia bacterium]
MMTKFVVDASVAMKWFIPEVHSAAAERLLHSRFDVSAPDLIRPEFGNVLWKKRRRGEINQKDALDILAGLESIGLEVHSSTALLVPAFEIATALDQTVYDSVYLALAVAQDCALITADRKFHSAVAASPLARNIRFVEDGWS